MPNDTFHKTYYTIINTLMHDMVTTKFLRKSIVWILVLHQHPPFNNELLKTFI